MLDDFFFVNAYQTPFSNWKMFKQSEGTQRTNKQWVSVLVRLMLGTLCFTETFLNSEVPQPPLKFLPKLETYFILQIPC